MLNQLIFPETKKLIEACGEENIRFVGGCVRDLVAGIPVQDIDFATKLTPEQVILECQKYGIPVIPTGIKFGTVTAQVNGLEFEITTLRRDLKTDGRHAVVEFTDEWEIDALRRDFTINSFYLTGSGKLIDYFGGMDHLRVGKVTFIGNPEDRIKEDYLRILRYFRFFGRFGRGEPDETAVRACARYSMQVNYLSGERIQAEMFKILALPDCSKTLEYMQNYGILNFIFPGDVTFKTLRELEKIETAPNPLRRLAAIEGYDLQQLASHWKLSTEQTKILKTITQPVTISDPKILLRHLGKDRFNDVVYLESARGKLDVPLEQVLDFANTWRIPKFTIYGNDVMALGIAEGRAIGQILSKLENYWEQHGYLLSREELLKRLKVIVEEFKNTTIPQ